MNPKIVYGIAFLLFVSVLVLGYAQYRQSVLFRQAQTQSVTKSSIPNGFPVDTNISQVDIKVSGKPLAYYGDVQSVTNGMLRVSIDLAEVDGVPSEEGHSIVSVVKKEYTVKADKVTGGTVNTGDRVKLIVKDGQILSEEDGSVTTVPEAIKLQVRLPE